MFYGKSENLLDKLFNYINDTKDERLEVKPKEFNDENILENKFVISVCLGVFFAVCGGAGIYYYNQYCEKSQHSVFS